MGRSFLIDMLKVNIFKIISKVFMRHNNEEISCIEDTNTDTNLENSEQQAVIEDSDIKQEVSDLQNTNEIIEVVRTKTDLSVNNTLVLGLSLLGESHKRHMLKCQDYHLFKDLGDGWHLFIVSDGAGSADYSEIGSKFNCELAADYISSLISQNDWKERNKLPSELEWYIEIRSIFEKIKLYFRNYMADFPNSCEKDFNATILVCIRTPNGILSSHIGDGRMGYRNGDGIWYSLMKPHKGEEANQTIFLQNSWTVPTVPALRINDNYVPEVRIVNDSVSSIVLLSDGCERAAWECVIWNEELEKYEDRNNPYPKFLDPLLDALDETSREEKILCLQEILECGTEACRRESDDKTMLIGIY